VSNDQQFVIAVITIIVPVVSSGLLIVSAVVAYFIQTQKDAQRHALEQEQRAAVVIAAEHAVHAASVAADNASAAANVAAGALSEVHAAVLEVGEKADASYKEANNANLKIQAVLDANNISLGLPTVPVTAGSLRNAAKE
jgi:hypothetical protein